MASRTARSASVIAGLLLMVVGTLPAAAAASAVRASDAAAPGGRLIVLWRNSAPAAVGLAGVRRVEAAETSQRTVVVARSGQAGAVAAALRRDPRVLAVVPDATVKALDWPNSGDPSDPLYPEQEDLDQIGVPEVWPTTTGDPDVVVAVLDTGVDLDHPDLDGVAVTAPRNMIWNTSDVSDVYGHGTHVAGTIFAQADNETGIAGIAPDSTLMPVKVLDDNGFGSFSDVLDGVDWAREHGADIINLSLGGSLAPEQVALMQPTFTAAREAGILTVAASGNSGSPQVFYPAGLNGVLAVGAVDQDDFVAEFSTFSRVVDISAPGVDTLSTVYGDYERWSGTSMASPHVAGVAALVWADRAGLNVRKLEAVLRSSAVDLGDPGWDRYFGDGRLDAAAALDAPVPDPLPELEPAPGPVDPFTLEFTYPDRPTRVTGRFTVTWTANYPVWDGFLVRYSWRLVGGQCPWEWDSPTGYTFLPFSTQRAQNLSAGYCYLYYVVAVDEEGRVAEALSDPVSVVDVVRPTVRSRTPAANATGVAPGTSVRVGFSEPVRGVSGSTLRLKNLTTGRWVNAAVRYNSASNMATIDPSRAMIRGNRYAVYATSGIQDRSGNHLRSTSWTFRTAP